MSTPRILLVHGVPESSAVWGPFESALHSIGVPTQTLSPPGFGAPPCPAFPSTMAGYRDWLIAELHGHADVEGPAWLLGHDWGGIHVLGAVLARPDLVAGWISDALGVFHPDYRWHELARLWQTPDSGEAALASMVSQDQRARSASFEDRGMPASVAHEVSAAVDDDMAKAILSLYRSAEQPALSDLGRHLAGAASRPGLAVSPTEDHVTGLPPMRRDMAATAGAAVLELDGLGHWWFAQDPARSAAAIYRFLSAQLDTNARENPSHSTDES